MSEFTKREAATLSPTQCAFCHDHEGPFIDTHVEWPAYGHVWVCAANDRRSGCVRQMAALDSMIHPEVLDYANDRIAELEEELVELRAALGDRRVALKTVQEAIRLA